MRHRGVYLLPNLLTTGALFAGFYSVISGINGHFAAAAVAVVVAGLLDGLDGRVARMTHSQSDFGVQYDSLSDLVSFGLAPALLSFNWSLRSLGELGPLAGKPAQPCGWRASTPRRVSKTRVTSRGLPVPRQQGRWWRPSGFSWTTASTAPPCVG
jgi:CDP-diacylglycerol--serine O-phosphatidyltransferase